MFAGLAHSVARSWCGVINSPSSGDHFRRRYQTPRRRLSQRRGPLPKLLWAELFVILDNSQSIQDIKYNIVKIAFSSFLRSKSGKNMRALYQHKKKIYGPDGRHDMRLIL